MTTRKKIDYHLQQMAAINSNIGKDSTATEKAEAKRLINAHLADIYAIDHKFFDVIKPDEVHL